MAKISSRSALAATLSAVVLLLSYAFAHLLSAPPSIFSPPVTLTGCTGQVLVGADDRTLTLGAFGGGGGTAMPVATVGLCSAGQFTDPGAVAWTENGEAMLLIRSTEDPQPSTAAVIAIADSSP
ncbi:hypothetical protein ACFZB9_09035 [Kitasatospora sp. NPDC008050]|uniref:hypothetical protein n=1 Tax=Kitasatospora sp. NPDC008050 TaxID=3364021 RepID=UPI0036F1014B